MKRTSLLILLTLASVSCFAVTTATLPQYIYCGVSPQKAPINCQKCSDATCSTKTNLPTGWKITATNQNFQGGIYKYTYVYSQDPNMQKGVNAIFDVAGDPPPSSAQISAKYSNIKQPSNTASTDNIVLSSWSILALLPATVTPGQPGYNPNFVKPAYPSIDTSWTCPFPIDKCVYVPATTKAFIAK